MATMKLLSLALPLAPLVSGTVHTIHVGTNGADVFTPPSLNPKVGDIVVFQLESFHNIVEGTFDQPCIPKPNGFYSGEYPGTDRGRLRFVTQVTSPDPVYYYCSVGRHCQVGMVGGFNVPTQGKTLSDYTSRAKSVAKASTPSTLRGGQLLDAKQILQLNKTVAGAEVDPANRVTTDVDAFADVGTEAVDAIPPWFPGPGPLGLGLPGLPATPALAGPPPGVTGPPPWLPGPPPGVVGSPPSWLPFTGSFLPASLSNSTALSSIPVAKISSLFSAIQDLFGDFLDSLAASGITVASANDTVPIRGRGRF